MAKWLDKLNFFDLKIYIHHLILLRYEYEQCLSAVRPLNQWTTRMCDGHQEKINKQKTTHCLFNPRCLQSLIMTNHSAGLIFTLYTNTQYLVNHPILEHRLCTTISCVTSCTCSTYRAHSACLRRSETLLRSLQCRGLCSKSPGRCAAGPRARWSAHRWRCERPAHDGTRPWWCRRCSPNRIMTDKRKRKGNVFLKAI